MSSFVITKRFNNFYKFEFTSRRGKTIFTSLGYELKFECENAILVFKSEISNCNFEPLKVSGTKHCFKIIFNNTVMATSRKYSTELRAIKGIEEIKKYCKTAEILDFSNQNLIFDSSNDFSN